LPQLWLSDAVVEVLFEIPDDLGTSSVSLSRVSSTTARYLIDRIGRRREMSESPSLLPWDESSDCQASNAR
jgi:hypothetical protein